MKNFVFISPHFPNTYYRFVQGLAKNGFRVLGIGDCPYDQLAPELKQSLTEYYACYNMENFEEEAKAVAYFENKYGHIDYLESNNEYWLQRDAWLRDRFHITTGVSGKEIKVYQHKSMMK
ncbi:MAG: carbamoylphosphate synthase large subunit, partial [Bacilli bacterium]|nr:carbamoylphosphate synthase large subunit [Bacilli bacterium]